MTVVVGAAAVDLVARRERFRAETSNPASIGWSAGGVGHRIWRRLPPPKLLLSAVGDDPAGRWLEERIGAEARRSAGRAEAILLRSPRQATAIYCALMQSGRLLYGAADMAVIERGLSPARLRPHLPRLGRGDLLVLEANLSPALVDALLRRYAGLTRVVFEAVSVEKLLRHEPRLRDLYLLSLNDEEQRALRGQIRPQSRGQEWVGPFLAERRIAHLLEPRGKRGVRLHALAADGRYRVTRFFPARVVRAGDSTGAGDRLLAAVLARIASPAGRSRAGGIAAALPAAMREVEEALEKGDL
jgi:sugar/nucleoside kinase (ribokinase family)